jgi:nucleoside-diphosphate-sugar epimerase
MDGGIFAVVLVGHLASAGEVGNETEPDSRSQGYLRCPTGGPGETAMSTYLVTGGSGFLGSALVRRLVRQGHRVRVLDNNSRGNLRRLRGLEDDFEFIEGDVRNPEAVDRAVEGVDSVCHLAFVNGTEFFYTVPELVLEVGVKGMINVIDACLKHRVPELILASSSEVYHEAAIIPTDESVPLSIPDPRNPRYSYAAGKLISEVIALNYGRSRLDRVLIFRPHNVYGPDMGWEHVIPQFVLRMKDACLQAADPVLFPIQGTGKQTRSFIFIDDFIEALMLVIEKGEHLGIYHVGTMEEVTIEALAGEVARYFERPIAIVPSEPAPGGTSRRCPDIRRLTALGFVPQLTLRDGLHSTATWYDKNSRLAPGAAPQQ